MRWERPFPSIASFTQDQRRLVGAYFLHEYSFEAAALFNPSIVRHPDQSGAPEGGRRFILSLRAVGEGHISSLTFRVRYCRRGRQRQRRSAGAAGFHSASCETRTGPDARPRSSCSSEPEEDISERVIFPVTALAVEWHRGRALRGVRGGGREDLLRHLHRLYRPGHPLGIDRDPRLRDLPHVAAAAAAPRTTRAWRCFRAGSPASTP